MKRRNDPAAWPLRLHYHVSNVTVSMLLMLYLFLLLMLRQGAIAGTLFALVMTGLLCIRPVNELLECKRQRDVYREILQNGQAFSGRVVDVRQRPHYTRELEEGENIRFGGSRHNPNSGVSARQVLDVWREGYEYILVIRLENQTVIESEPYLEPLHRMLASPMVTVCRDAYGSQWAVTDLWLTSPAHSPRIPLPDTWRQFRRMGPAQVAKHLLWLVMIYGGSVLVLVLLLWGRWAVQ